MKLKEWGLMRNKGRKARAERTRASNSGREHDNQEPGALPATVEPISIESEYSKHIGETDGLDIVGSSELTIAESTFMGLLNQTIKYVLEAYLRSIRTDPTQTPTPGRDTGLDARYTHRLRTSHGYAWLCP